MLPSGDQYFTSPPDAAPAPSGSALYRRQPQRDAALPHNAHLDVGPEQRILQEVIALSQTIDKAPISRLAPLAPQIERISTHYRRISRHIRACSGEDTPGNPVVSEKDRKLAAVDKLLTSTTGLIDEIQAAAEQFKQSSDSSFKDTHQDKHVQTILQFQKRKFSSCSAAGEKILLICACKSLAKDFRQFEMQGGMDSKQDQLTARILQGRDPGVQTISKNLQNFLSAGDGASSALRAKLDAALRFGIKLEVADALGASLGLGSSLSLLFGCECVGFSKLPYTSFHSLQQTLKQNHTLLEPVRKFAEKLEPWWKQFSEAYHLRFATQQPMTNLPSDYKLEGSTSPSTGSIESLSPALYPVTSASTFGRPVHSQSVSPFPQALAAGPGSYDLMMNPHAYSTVEPRGMLQHPGGSLIPPDLGIIDWDFHNSFDPMVPLNLPPSTSSMNGNNNHHHHHHHNMH